MFTPKLYTLFLPRNPAPSCNLGFDLCNPTFLAIKAKPLADSKKDDMIAEEDFKYSGC